MGHVSEILWGRLAESSPMRKSVGCLEVISKYQFLGSQIRIQWNEFIKFGLRGL